MKTLAGKRIVVTRPRDRAGTLAAELEMRGARAIVLPAIEIAPMEDSTPLDNALARLGSYDWIIFTSVSGVAVFWERLARSGHSLRDLDGVSIAAIGPATAGALRDRGADVKFVPPEFVAERILDGLGDVEGKRMLLPRADIARKALADDLRTNGAFVDEIPVYRTIAVEASESLLDEVRAGVDAVTFTSSSTVRSFHATFGGLPAGAIVACIGPITANTARELGYPVHVQAQDYTGLGLVEALERYFAGGAVRPLEVNR